MTDELYLKHRAERRSLPKPATLLPAERQVILRRCVQQCLSLPGDFAELGVYQGGSARLIALAAPLKTLHLFDTFSGHPHDDIEGGHHQGEFAAPLDEVKAACAGHKVVFHPGIFPGTAVDVPYAFVHLDADLYQSTAAALDYFVPRLVEGGIILLDDVGQERCPGVQKAIEERRLDVQIVGRQGIYRKGGTRPLARPFRNLGERKPCRCK